MNWARLTTVAVLAAGLSGCSLFRGFSAGPDLRAIDPVPPSPHQQRRLAEARAESDAGNYDSALELFQEILAENPTITTAYLGIGEIHVVRQEYAEAEPAYRRAARLEPRNFDAQYGHGLALQMLERFLEAILAYHRALTVRPESPKANLNLATTYLQSAQPDRAVIFAERAVQLEPENGSARVNLGAIYEQVGRPEEAVDAYLAALELMGNRPPLMMNLIGVQVRVNRYHEAMNTAETLVRIEPTAEAYERLGWCAFKLREYERSLDAYREAADLDPGHWPALNGIGVNTLNAWLLSKKRDTRARDDARDAFRRSLRANPDQPKVVALMLNYNL